MWNSYSIISFLEEKFEKSKDSLGNPTNYKIAYFCITKSMEFCNYIINIIMKIKSKYFHNPISTRNSRTSWNPEVASRFHSLRGSNLILIILFQILRVHLFKKSPWDKIYKMSSIFRHSNIFIILKNNPYFRRIQINPWSLQVQK